MKLIIITPTRNEEKSISITIESMRKQTLLPIKWIIVNDGSTDNTEKIIKELTNNISFVKYVHIPDRGYRKPGQGVIETFYEGYNCIENDYDILAKFDADLQFPPDTLEKICKAFRDDPKLGITGGAYYERLNNKGTLKRVLFSEGYVGGPVKFYRKKCFEDINGLIQRAGWDGVDIIKAKMKGWNTGEIEALKIIHLKPTGTAAGEGLKRACNKYGDVSYYMGGYLWYFCLRVIGRSLENRNLKIGYHMVRGFLRSYLNKLDRESPEFRNFLKKMQRKSMIHWFKLLLNSPKRT